MWRRGVSFLAAALMASTAHAGSEQLCAIAPGTYAAAKSSHPELAFAIAEVEKQGTATWYTDRGGDPAATAKQIVATCPSSSRMVIIVYGLPNKDCEARESMVGSTNTNSAMYQQFVSTLQQTVGDRKVLYVVEPDAIALLAHGGCAKSFGYSDNLAIAVRTLSQNPNADIYLDVGHWMLSGGSDLNNVASIVRQLASVGRVKGITINTSNYRSNSELSGLCSKFRSATSGLDLHCIIDSSRNYNGPSSQDEWCNYKNAGIGKAPTGNTGDPNIDYYVWLKPPGESDGTCAGRTSDSALGPGAGGFFADYFKQLWNEGALVKELGMPKIDGTIRPVGDTPTPAPTQAPTEAPTPAPTPAATEAPSLTPEPVSETTAPSNSTDVAEQRTAGSASSAGSAAHAAAGSAGVAVEESGTVSAGVVVSAPTDVPIFINTPQTIAPDADVTDATGAQQVNTQSGAGSSASAGVVVLGCLVGAAVVALVAVVAIRKRQRALEETKTPLDPRIHYLHNTNTPGNLSSL